MQLQLRTPRDMRIEDLVSELALSIQDSLKRELDSKDVPIENFRVLQGRIVGAIFPFLKAYDSCGKNPICTEGSEGRRQPDPLDQIYLLDLPSGLYNFLDELSSAVLTSIRSYVGKRTTDALNQHLKASLLRSLSKYSYWNPACRNHEFCKTSHPISPWNPNPV